jgi:hypothetical protein
MLEEIMKSKRKPKEKVILLTSTIMRDKKLFKEFMEILKTGSDGDKGTCADVMKHLTKDKPEIVLPYINELIQYINYKAPRVKWGIPESIGHMAQHFPGVVEKAVPKLLINTKDRSTVVRWCAAFALTEIAKKNLKLQESLINKFLNILKEETNNGVKNVYTRALKEINR